MAKSTISMAIFYRRVIFVAKASYLQFGLREAQRLLQRQLIGKALVAETTETPTELSSPGGNHWWKIEIDMGKYGVSYGKIWENMENRDLYGNYGKIWGFLWENMENSIWKMEFPMGKIGNFICKCGGERMGTTHYLQDIARPILMFCAYGIGLSLICRGISTTRHWIWGSMVGWHRPWASEGNSWEGIPNITQHKILLRCNVT